MWFYAHYVLAPIQKSFAVAHRVPRGNLSDLYPRWLGARELLRNGKDPYSPEMTREIQVGYYGRSLNQDYLYDPRDQAGFAYPAYVVFLLAPTILLPFAVVQTGVYWLFIAVMTGTVILWFKALQWRPQQLTLLTAIVFGLGCFPAIQALALLQLTILVAGFLALAFVLTIRRKFVIAGLVLALSTIKPQITIPSVVWLGLWAVSDWRERKGLLLGFLGGMAVLFASAQWVLPGWVTKFYHAVIAYQQYTLGMTSADVLFGPCLGRIVTSLLVIVAVVVSWRSRSKMESSPEFAFASCFILATTAAIVPTFAPYNQLLLFPGLLFLIQHRRSLSPKKRWQKILLSIAVFAICWQWIAAIVLSVIYCFVSKAFVERMWEAPFYASIPLPMILMCLLYVCAATTRRTRMAQATP
jgi:hypothetical protein